MAGLQILILRRPLSRVMRLAESPPAYSVSEREADDQTDCNFKHSDKRMGRDENPAPSVKRLKGGVSRDPRRVPA
jgi:hypothetical protein